MDCMLFVRRALGFASLLIVLAALVLLPATAGATTPQHDDQAAQVQVDEHAVDAVDADEHNSEQPAVHVEHHEPGLGTRLPLWSAIPFVGILLSIAVFPLVAPHFWHKNFPKISALWALLFAVPFLIAYKAEALQAILHIYLIDYIPFIILLWALFTVSGGIYVGGSLR